MMSSQFLRTISLLATLIVAPIAGTTVGQETGSSPAFASGLNSPAIQVDFDRNPVLEIQVTNIEPDWQEFGTYETPNEGEAYVKVDVAFKNVASDAIEVIPENFIVYDSLGRHGEMNSFREAEGIWKHTDDLIVEQGQSLEGSMVFSLRAEYSVAWVTYSSFSKVMIVVEEIEPGFAMATGLNVPAIHYNDDGTAQVEMQVLGMERDWQESASQTPLPPGMQLIKVDMKFTNLTDQPAILTPFFMGVQDGWGQAAGTANVSPDYWSVNEITLEPGEPTSISIIVMMNIDADVALLSYGNSIIYLGE